MSTSRTVCTGAATLSAEIGEGVAVLLRAIEPLEGLDQMRARRPAARRDHDLASGPGKLSQAFGLDRSFDGADLVTGSHGIVIASDGVPPPADPVVGPRIGITRAVDFPGAGMFATTVTFQCGPRAGPQTLTAMRHVGITPSWRYITRYALA